MKSRKTKKVYDGDNRTVTGGSKGARGDRIKWAPAARRPPVDQPDQHPSQPRARPLSPRTRSWANSSPSSPCWRRSAASLPPSASQDASRKSTPTFHPIPLSGIIIIFFFVLIKMTEHFSLNHIECLNWIAIVDRMSGSDKMIASRSLQTLSTAIAVIKLE